MRIMLFLSLAAGLAAPALATDRTGYKAIAAGDYQKAEETLLVERRIFPRRPELMINLATVYARTGRVAEAAALYRAAMQVEPVEMMLPDGMVSSSHEVAQRGVNNLSRVTLAVR
ncbi:tetratricopeptide repeat protein [Sphingomonas mucosissima]|uniref:Tetratricopeptide repeat protein n=1 Tax=Sphingomonas mucosissima TaxID=370959 RepID=A0A245ZT76_9SPHN|nr:tetratricopeptide repeat protein [Sphingomonas mucosissima]OWK32910.1 tetratricopeptide repeat protein [Sphingomonas mucosissima]